MKKVSYHEAKARAREIAIDWQLTDGSNYNYSWEGIIMVGDYFHRLGKRYGLLREFRENAIPC